MVTVTVTVQYPQEPEGGIDMTESHYGYIINTYYNHLNMLSKMKDKNPQRFGAFDYSQTHIYDMIDRLQHQQNLYD